MHENVATPRRNLTLTSEMVVLIVTPMLLWEQEVRVKFLLGVATFSCMNRGMRK